MTEDKNMKKIASLLLAVVMLAAMLSVFAVPAFAETEPTVIEPRTVVYLPDYGWFNELFIDDPGNYIITHDVDVSAIRIVDVENAVLTIPEGVTVVVRNAIIISGTVELLGTLDVSQCLTVNSEYLNRIHVGATGNLIKREEQPQQQGDDPYKVVPQQGEPYIYSGSALSGGSLTVIVGIAAAVVFGLGGFFIGKAVGKKKKPALVSGTDNTDEE